MMLFRRKRNQEYSDHAEQEGEHEDHVSLFMQHGVRMGIPSVTGFIPSNSRVLSMSDPDQDPNGIMNQVTADSLALAFDSARQLAAASSYGHISLEQQMEHARHFAASHFAAIQAIPPPPIAAPAMVAPPPPIASPAMVSMHTPQGFAPINPVPVSLGPQMSQLQMSHELQSHQVQAPARLQFLVAAFFVNAFILRGSVFNRYRILCSINILTI
jgi:hypothetical protein